MDMVLQLVPIVGLTRAVNFIDKKRGDEGENIRLLSTFQKQFPYRINDIYPIRNQVYKIKTNNGLFILKGYSSYNRLKLQETFTASLQKEGFHKTYTFLDINGEPIVYQKHYYGCLPFIEPHHRSFSFQNDQERHEGLALLDEFHRVTEQSVKRYQTLIPEFNIQKKWTERCNEFLQNVNTVAKYIPRKIILEWTNWAKWSLEGIFKHSTILEKETPVILHGDVAHHNFLRRKDGKLFIIDFDLISIGSRNMDLLQYANRILPFINWDINDMSRYKSLNGLLSNSFYLYALVYPTDLFREWNRLIREDAYQNPYKLQMVKEQSLLKFNFRQRYNNEIINMIAKNGFK